ncbi:hypothetical protein [Streptomyces sp. NBC_01304]|uniref:hypothetical protein n=1 Tax=Streptomyces sp. NBC_01304 TaxID=2903818 RepID=UPI002E0D3CE1|nr:hypothetical protein OG430_02645 [Streptomyces sp. NBC_01304]
MKQLPVAAIPVGGVETWSAADAERWRAARAPVIFTPVAGSWVAAVVVVVSYVLASASSSSSAVWHGGANSGTDWLRYPAAVLLASLPLWYRHLSELAGAAAAIVAVNAGFSLASADGGGQLAGCLLVLAVCAWAFTGGCLRLRARRRQHALFLAAAGRRRFPLPRRVPESDGFRGHAQFYTGLVFCLIAAGLLISGLVKDLTGDAYDAVGQQIAALLFLLPGSTLYAQGLTTYWAARRLHEEEAHPALRVGIRIAPDGRHWIHPDARTPAGQPLISYVPGDKDTRKPPHLLGSSSSYGLGDGHHSIDPRSEPFEAVLYGPVHEGAEIVVAYATITYHPRQDTGQMYSDVTTAALLPHRRHGLAPWQPVDGIAHERARREKVREDAARSDRAEEQLTRYRAQRATRAKQAGAGTAGGSAAGGGGCGGGCGSGGGGDGCGGGCGGCGG